MKRYYVHVTDDTGATMSDEWLNTTAAIVRMQELITRLRRPDLERFDMSFGEQPAPIIGPSPEELTAFINRGQAA